MSEGWSTNKEIKASGKQRNLENSMVCKEGKRYQWLMFIVKTLYKSLLSQPATKIVIRTAITKNIHNIPLSENFGARLISRLIMGGRICDSVVGVSLCTYNCCCIISEGCN